MICWSGIPALLKKSLLLYSDRPIPKSRRAYSSSVSHLKCCSRGIYKYISYYTSGIYTFSLSLVTTGQIIQRLTNLCPVLGNTWERGKLHWASFMNASCLIIPATSIPRHPLLCPYIKSSSFLSKWHLARVLTALKCSLAKNSLPAVHHSTRLGLLPFPTNSTLKLFLISLPILFHWGIDLSTSRPFGTDMLLSLRCRKCVGRYGQRFCDIFGSALKCMMAWRQERDS